MIKELFLAIILGSLLGFGFTGGYLAIKKNSNTVEVPKSTNETTIAKTTTIQTSPTPTIVNNNQDVHRITIDSPENESISSSSIVTVKGSSSPQSRIIINTPIKSYFTSTNNSGNFNLTVDIDSGPNIIHIDSFDTEDNVASVQILVTYSTAKF